MPTLSQQINTNTILLFIHRIPRSASVEKRYNRLHSDKSPTKRSGKQSIQLQFLLLETWNFPSSYFILSIFFVCIFCWIVAWYPDWKSIFSEYKWVMALHFFHSNEWTAICVVHIVYPEIPFGRISNIFCMHFIDGKKLNVFKIEEKIRKRKKNRIRRRKQYEMKTNPLNIQHCAWQQ